MKNIHTQSEILPEQIDGTYPPTREQLLDAGWRDVPPQPEIADGYTRVSCTFAEGDGVTGAWQVVDRPTSEIDAEAVQAEAARQAAKPLALRAVENRFLLFCEQLTGSRTKAGFAELRGVIEAMAANPATTAQALVVAAQLTAINDEGFREGGLRWWDDCTWHEEIAQ